MKLLEIKNENPARIPEGLRELSRLTETNVLGGGDVCSWR